MPAWVRRVRGRTFRNRHGEQESLLAVWVLPGIVCLHPREKILRAFIGGTFHATRGR